MHFIVRPEGWNISFLEPDLKTALSRRFIFQDPAKVVEMAMRGGADRTSADKQTIEYDITNGRGLVWLNLTVAQYAKLRKSGLRQG